MRNRCIVYLTLFLLFSVNCIDVFADPLNQKNLYVSVESYPSGAGMVYVDVCEKDQPFVKDKSGWGEVSMLKATLEQNGQDPSKTAMFEAVVSAKPSDDYEFVCYSYEPLADDKAVYIEEDLFVEATSADKDSRTFLPAFNALGVNGTGAILNVYSGVRQDGDIEDHSREELFNADNWSAVPDITVYAIFRRKGEFYPYLDVKSSIDEVAPGEQVMDGKKYNLKGQEVDNDYRGIVICNGKKYITQ